MKHEGQDKDENFLSVTDTWQINLRYCYAFLRYPIFKNHLVALFLNKIFLVAITYGEKILKHVYLFYTTSSNPVVDICAICCNIQTSHSIHTFHSYDPHLCQVKCRVLRQTTLKASSLKRTQTLFSVRCEIMLLVFCRWKSVFQLLNLDSCVNLPMITLEHVVG